MDRIIGFLIIAIAIIFLIVRYYRIFTKKQSPCGSCSKSKVVKCNKTKFTKIDQNKNTSKLKCTCNMKSSKN